MHRRVTATMKSKDGDILALCNKQESWSPRFKSDTISDVERGRYRYYVQQAGTEAVEVRFYEL